MGNPEYIVLVALDTPSRETGIYISGGVMAAPTVGAVLSDILPYLGVAKAADEGYAVLDDLTGLSPEEARAILNEKKLEALYAGEGGTVVSQIPQAGRQVPEGSQILLYLGQ